MRILEHLFLVGEYSERAYLLSGLTLEQVTLRPESASHSIRGASLIERQSRAAPPLAVVPARS